VVSLAKRGEQRIATGSLGPLELGVGKA